MGNQTQVTAHLVVIGPNNPCQQVKTLVELGNRLTPKQWEAVLHNIATATATATLVFVGSQHPQQDCSPVKGLHVEGEQTKEQSAKLEALPQKEGQACADSTLGPVTAEALFQPKAMDALDALVIAVNGGVFDTKPLLDALLVPQHQDATPPHQGDGTSSEVDPQVLQCLQDIIAQLELLGNQNESQPSSACSTPRSEYGPVEELPEGKIDGAQTTCESNLNVSGLQAKERLFPESQITLQARALREQLNAALQGHGITAEVIVIHQGSETQLKVSPAELEIRLYVETPQKQEIPLASSGINNMAGRYSEESYANLRTPSHDTSSSITGSSDDQSAAMTRVDHLEELITCETEAAASNNLMTGVSRGNAKHLAHVGLNDSSLEGNQMIAKIIERTLGMTPQAAREALRNTRILSLVEKNIEGSTQHNQILSPRAMEPQNTNASHTATAAAAVQQGLLSNSKQPGGGSPQERYVMGPLAIRVLVVVKKQAFV